MESPMPLSVTSQCAEPVRPFPYIRYVHLVEHKYRDMFPAPAAKLQHKNHPLSLKNKKPSLYAKVLVY